MPTSTLTPGDEKQDEKNIGQHHADQTFDSLRRAENAGTPDMSSFEDHLADDKLAKDAPSTSEQYARQREASGDWENKTEPNTNSEKKVWFKSKKTWFGIGGGGGLIGALLFGGAMMPSFLLPSIVQNATTTNDARSGILERRLMQVINKKMSSSGVCEMRLAACRASKMPKSMLAAMERKGIVALRSDKSVFPIEGNGYVDANPEWYEFDDGNGKKQIHRAAFADEYKNNPALRKSLRSAYNMRFLGFNGLYMVKNFFKKFDIKRNGGAAADPDFNEGNARDKLNEKLASKTDGDGESGTKKRFADRLSKFLNRSATKAKKAGGDPVLTVGTFACIGLEMPGFVVGTYRAIQSAQLILLLSDLILSPGGMQQAGAADGKQIAAIGALLTQRVKDASGNLGKSALDSPILQSALGINKNPVAVSKFAPGYSLITNKTLSGISGFARTEGVKETCDVINTPQAAMASAGITAAIGASTMGLGAIGLAALKAVGKVAIAMGAIEEVMKKAQEVGLIDAIANSAYDLVKDGVGNYVEDVHGEELGDALGTAIYTFYPTASLAGGAAVLTTSQVGGFAAVMNEVEEDHRQEDIATMSPFDTSSQYTFLGSLVSNLSLYSVVGDPVKSSLSMLGHILRSPFSILTKPVMAVSTAEANCNSDNATTLNVDGDIAVNPAGYPCTGIPAEYVNMPVDEVNSLVDGQIDEETGIPHDDSDITLMMADCSEGDLESVSGCTISDTQSTSDSVEVCAPNDDGVEECSSREVIVPGISAKQRAAQSLYLFDMQVEAMLSGADEEPEEGDLASGEYVLPLDPGYTISAGFTLYDPFNTGEAYQHMGIDFAGGTAAMGGNVYAVADGEVVAIDRGNNNSLIIRHVNGLMSRYMHMELADITVSAGDSVLAGQLIGKVGNYGDSTGAHLHFEFNFNDETDSQFTSLGDEFKAIRTDRRSLDPVTVFSMLGVDIINGTYTDGRNQY